GRRAVRMLRTNARGEHAVDDVDACWLFDVLVESGFECPLSISGAGISSQRNQKNLGGLLIPPKRSRDVLTVHAGKPDVTYDDIGPERQGQLDSGRTVVRGFYIVAVECEQCHQGSCSIDMVVDDEHFSSLRLPSLWIAAG